jgi:hypothetical protein
LETNKPSLHQIQGDSLSPEQVKALVPALTHIVEVLAEAEPQDKPELYAQLGISLAYDPDGTVTVESRPRGVTVRVGGGTTPGRSWATAQVCPRFASVSRTSSAVASPRLTVTSASFGWRHRSNRRFATIPPARNTLHERLVEAGD